MKVCGVFWVLYGALFVFGVHYIADYVRGGLY